MKYYILSAAQSDDCPISLVEDAILYADKKQIDLTLEHGSLPWYSYKTSKNCELPKGGVLVLKNKNIKISFRNINNNIYIVNDFFKNLLLNKINSEFFEVELFSDQLEKIDNNQYYIFRFNCLLNYTEVINLKKSTYNIKDDLLTLEKVDFVKDINERVFKINNIDIAQDTFFIDEFVKNEIEKVKPIGIKIFDLDNAKWRQSDDFSFLFLPLEEVNQLIWPI